MWFRAWLFFVLLSSLSFGESVDPTFVRDLDGNDAVWLVGTSREEVGRVEGKADAALSSLTALSTNWPATVAVFSRTNANVWTDSEGITWRRSLEYFPAVSEISFSADFATRFSDVPPCGSPGTNSFPFDTGAWHAMYDGSFYVYVSYNGGEGPCVWQADCPGGSVNGTVLTSVTEDFGTATLRFEAAHYAMVTSFVSSFVSSTFAYSPANPPPGTGATSVNGETGDVAVTVEKLGALSATQTTNAIVALAQPKGPVVALWGTNGTEFATLEPGNVLTQWRIISGLMWTREDTHLPVPLPYPLEAYTGGGWVIADTGWLVTVTYGSRVGYGIEKDATTFFVEEEIGSNPLYLTYSFYCFTNLISTSLTSADLANLISKAAFDVATNTLALAAEEAYAKGSSAQTTINSHTQNGSIGSDKHLLSGDRALIDSISGKAPATLNGLGIIRSAFINLVWRGTADEFIAETNLTAGMVLTTIYLVKE